MFESAAVVPTPTMESARVNVKSLNVIANAEVRGPIIDHGNRYLQGAFIFADQKFNSASAIEQRLKGELNGMFGWKNLGEASRAERLSGKKNGLPEWGADVNRWLGETDSFNKATGQLYREIIGKITDVPTTSELSEVNLRRLALEVRNPDRGMVHFVESALKLTNINNPGIITEVGNLAEGLFGSEIARNVIEQAIRLRLETGKEGVNVPSLANELFEKGMVATDIFKRNENSDAAYILGKIDSSKKKIISPIHTEKQVAVPQGIQLLSIDSGTGNIKIKSDDVNMQVIWAGSGSTRAANPDDGNMVVAGDYVFQHGRYYRNDFGKLIEERDLNKVPKSRS